VVETKKLRRAQIREDIGVLTADMVHLAELLEVKSHVERKVTKYVKARTARKPKYEDSKLGRELVYLMGLADALIGATNLAFGGRPRMNANKNFFNQGE